MQNFPVSPVRLIGMLTPSSNTVLEPYTSRLLEPLFPKVTAHFARFRVTRIALDDEASDQFSHEAILGAAELLADAHAEIIAWNGTSASWLGFDTDKRLCAAIETRTGIAATTAILNLNRLLGEKGVKRLALVTPYTADVAARIVDNYASIGVSTVAQSHSGLTDNFAFAEIPESAIAIMCTQAASANPDAIVILCTNMRGAMIGAEIEHRLGVPVYDSVSFALWGCLRALNIPSDALARFGSMFGSPSATPALTAPAE